jgi:hypothetical protein
MRRNVTTCVARIFNYVSCVMIKSHQHAEVQRIISHQLTCGMRLCAGELDVSFITRGMARHDCDSIDGVLVTRQVTRQA